jgi:hypothetical protein
VAPNRLEIWRAGGQTDAPNRFGPSSVWVAGRINCRAASVEPGTAESRCAVSPDAEPFVAAPDAPFVAVHVALPLLPAADLPLELPPEAPIDKPVKHPVHAIHGVTTRGRRPRPAFDRSIGVRYQALNEGVETLTLEGRRAKSRRVGLLARRTVRVRSSRDARLRSAQALRRDIAGAQSHIDRLQRRYLSGGGRIQQRSAGGPPRAMVTLRAK